MQPFVALTRFGDKSNIPYIWIYMYTAFGKNKVHYSSTFKNSTNTTIIHAGGCGWAGSPRKQVKPIIVESMSYIDQIWDKIGFKFPIWGNSNLIWLSNMYFKKIPNWCRTNFQNYQDSDSNFKLTKILFLKKLHDRCEIHFRNIRI